MQSRIVATVGILVGGIATILQLFEAFGVDLSDNQQQAIAATAGLVLMVVSAWFHTDIPVGAKDPDQPLP